MEDEADSGNNAGVSQLLNDSDERPLSAVNSVILDYYKKFGRKRDLEQYFSLTTAQCDIRDPRSLFWRRMKEQSDTSDSGEKKSESSNEICRISIKCSIPERSETEKGDSPSNNDSGSPPIINDDVPAASPSGDESIDDNQSQKSADATLDTSMNKPLSPTSSITSQRKLEWDSLADVGYGNESDKKTSASSLSTLEREVLAQKQQYTLDYKQTSDLGGPTAHSTPVDPNDSNPKGKKGQGKKTISISRKDVDFVEVNVPHNIENVQPINVNLTKQFCLNLQKDGGMSIDNIKKDISVSPEKSRGIKFDKEIQTSLLRSKEKDKSSVQSLERASTSAQKIPILIGLNTLRRNQRRKKMRKSRTKLKSRKKVVSKKGTITEKDKSGEQVSEAESFEYMPGHVYNQNQLRKLDSNRPNNNNTAGNKSSLESSAVHTTDSSRESKYSFSKDLDKTLDVLKSTLKEKYDSNLKKKLVKEIIHRLLKSNYGEGETTPEFLSVFSLTSKKTPTTSTSEADNTEEKVLHSKPKKSILRSSKFDPRDVASTSQSAPNLPLVVDRDKPVIPYLSKKVSTSTTETDQSNNSAKNASSDTVLEKTSSQELYKKYINALKREEAYKQHLKDKEMFLKQKLVRSEPVKNVPMQPDLSKNTILKHLIKDLTRNNYDDGSGDASILEGGSSNFDIIRQRPIRKHRSHSVFTLSSGSDMQDRNYNAKNKAQKNNLNSPRAGPSNRERHLAGSCNKPTVTDSSVQVNINVHDKPVSYNPPKSEEVKYVCLCEGIPLSPTRPACHHSPNEVEIHKCPISKPTIKAYVTNIPMCKIHSGSSSLKTDNNTNSYNKQAKAENPVVECTRCQQTKLSIHPKISDPSVSDLNIIDSAECVKLINELYRKISKTSSNTCKSSKDNRRNYDEEDNLKDENEITPLTEQQVVGQNITQSCVGCHKTFTNQPKSISDNIVIPIQGTNMMLKLSIGGNSMNVQNEQICKETPSQNITENTGIATNKIDTSLKDIPVPCDGSNPVKAEEFFGVQIRANSPSGSVKVNQEKYRSFRDSVPENRNVEKEVGILRKNDGNLVSDSERITCSTYPKTIQISEKKPLYRSNTDTGSLGGSSGLKVNQEKYSSFCDSVPENRNVEQEEGLLRKNDGHLVSNSGRITCSTYPKTFQISEKKPLYRSNTDTGSLGGSSGVQTETIYTKDKETLPYRRVEMKQDFESQMQPKSVDSGRTQPQSIKGTSSERSGSESSKSSTGERFHSFNTSKNKYSAEWRNLKEQKDYGTVTDEGKPRDLILDVIKDITKRYSKKDSDKRNKKKCFKEIITALSYLLDTDDSGDGEQEFTQSSKGFQYSKEQSLQSEGNSNDFQKKIEKSKAQSVAGTTVLTANVLTRKCDTYERNIKSAPSGRKKESRRFSEASGTVNPDNSFRKLDEAPIKTCDKGCGCDGASGCNDCIDSSCVNVDSERYGYKPPQPENVALKYQSILETVPDSKEFLTGSTDQEARRSEEVDASNKDNNKSSIKKVGNLPDTIKTCDIGCGCDGSTDCKDCGDANSSQKCSSSRINEEPEKPKTLCRRNSSNEIKTFCDKGCGCDGSSECKDCVEPHPLKPNNGQSDKESEILLNSKARCGLSKKTRITSDKSCGSDGSSEYKNFEHPTKLGSGKSEKGSKSKKQDRCTSPRRTETCDKECGCSLSDDCGDCHSPRTKKCGKESVKSKRQDRPSSPWKAKTCDRACGCDGLSECDECIEPYFAEHKTQKCGKEPNKPKNQNRCNKPKKVDTTCDSSCGCGGTSECKDCSHKSGRCEKEILRNKRQDAKKFVNKCVQSTVKRVKSLYSHRCDDSSDIPVSTDPPCCSTDSPTTKIVQKIKKECEKYQKRCKNCKKCEASSTTTVSCKHCKRADTHCRHHRCRCHRSRSTEKIKKKCVAYNLIVQTSDSLISEEAVFDQYRPLQNVIVRVPKLKRPNIPFKEAYAKVEQKMPYCDTRFEPKGRSQSWPNDCGISSTDDVKIANACTIRDYLERNRPDFVDRCESRQNCIRMTSECRSKERSELREQLVGLGSLPSLTNEELIYIAKRLGFRRNRPLQQKIMSEREMKKHSEKIYKSLPEVVQKKEDAKKDNIKKTNLLMANIFKKNLQKKVLSGDVNISNYSQVVKI